MDKISKSYSNCFVKYNLNCMIKVNIKQLFLFHIMVIGHADRLPYTNAYIIKDDGEKNGELLLNP